MRPAAAAPVALAAAVALALAAPARAGEKLAPGRAIFPYLDLYLGLPAASRTEFTLGYRLRLTGAPADALRVSAVGPEGRTPLPLDAEGRLQRLPTLAQWKGRFALEAPSGTGLSSTMRIEATLAPARELPAARLAAAVAQVNGAMRRAGPLALLAPRFSRVCFPGAEGGAVLAADGARTLMPARRGPSCFTPAEHPSAHTVVFDRAPAHLVLEPPPRAR